MRLLEIYKAEIKSKNMRIAMIGGALIGIVILFLVGRVNDIGSLINGVVGASIGAFTLPLLIGSLKGFRRARIFQDGGALYLIFGFLDFLFRFTLSVATNTLRFGVYASFFVLFYYLWFDIDAVRQVLANTTQDQARHALTQLFSISMIGGVLVSSVQLALFGPMGGAMVAKSALSMSSTEGNSTRRIK